MRTWRGTGIISTMRRTKTWDCRWGVEWSRVRVNGSSNSASREWGCAGVRTDLTICYTSDSPGSTARLRRCFRYSSNHPPTHNYAPGEAEPPVALPFAPVQVLRAGLRSEMLHIPILEAILRFREPALLMREFEQL